MMGALLALFAVLQAFAVAHACEMGARAVLAHHVKPAHCTEISVGVSHCELQHDAVCLEQLTATPGGTPDAKAGWPDVGFLVDASWFPRVAFAVPDARASRLSQLVPEVRNLSIALLNLRQ